IVSGRRRHTRWPRDWSSDVCSSDLANWLRTAFEPIVDRELKGGGTRIDADALLGFVRDATNHGRARRLALEVVEKLRPGTSEKRSEERRVGKGGRRRRSADSA